MVKSPTQTAVRFTMVFALLAFAWVLFDHFGPHPYRVLDPNHVYNDFPADVVFAVLTTSLLFFLVRHYLIAQNQAYDALHRSRNELEVRVQERTRGIDEERRKLRGILDAMPDGVSIISQTHDLEYINPAMEQEWGTVAGRKCYDYFADRNEPCPHCHLPQLLDGHSARWEWGWYKHEKTHEIVGTAVRAQDGSPAALHIYRDITEQVLARQRLAEIGANNARQAEELRHAHAELSSRARELTALLDISHSIASTLHSRQLLETILDQLKTMIDHSAAILYVTEGDGITAVAYRGVLGDDKINGLHIPLEHAPGFQSLVERRVPVIVDDLDGDDALARAIATAAHSHFPQTMTGARAWMGVPLMIGEQVTGMLRLDHPDPGHFSARDAQIALAIANHAAVAIENARLYEEAHKVAVLEERQRMARDLHDSVSQALYGIALGAHAAHEQAERAPEKLSATLDYILSMSATAIAEMRALVFELRPDSLEQEGMTTALTKLTDAWGARTGSAIKVALDEEPPLSYSGKETLYRIAQEALQNVARHARAANVSVGLWQCDGWVVLEVRDDGVGFDPVERLPGHYGLRTMHERALRLGGTIQIDSTPDAGTVVRARIPATASEL